MDSQNTPAPPPPPEYYVLNCGHVLGPFSIEELRTAVAEERLSAADFVQTGGLPIWRPIARVLDVDYRVPLGAVAPEWRSILTWAWLRLRHNVEEQSLAAGFICIGIGLAVLFLSRFPAIMWLPWFIPAGMAAIALFRQRQAVKGSLLLALACTILLVIAAIHLRQRDHATRGGRSGDILAAKPGSSALTQPSAEGELNAPEASSPPGRFAPEKRSAPDSTSLAANPVGELHATDQPSLDRRVTPVSPPLPAPAPSIESVNSPPPPAIAIASVPAITQSEPPATAIAATAPAPPPLPPLVSPPTKETALPDPPLLGGDLVQRYRESLIVIRDGDGAGSGFLCRKGERVWLFTNNHVAAGMKQPVFSRLDGTRITVGPAESAAGYDAMRFSVAASPARPLECVTQLEGLARIDDEVVVLGNSGGGGVVTSLKGKLVGIGPDRIEVSAEFIPGNSGSPIVHVPSGKVIGIATYLTRRYEEFSANGEPPGGAGTAKPPGLRGQGTLVTRRFGFRLDNVPRWEPVNWQAFQSEAEQLRQISALTEDVFDFLGALRQRGSPQFATETLRRPAQQWLDLIRRPRQSEADKLNATHSFLNALRSMVRADVSAAEARLRYSYFRERLSEERSVREKMYQAFDSETRRLASPTAR